MCFTMTRHAATKNNFGIHGFLESTPRCGAARNVLSSGKPAKRKGGRAGRGHTGRMHAKGRTGNLSSAFSEALSTPELALASLSKVWNGVCFFA